MGHIEVVVFCALLIHIFNSFYVISSVRGFLESSKIIESKHDIILLDNDLIKASDQKNAALTLPRLILVRGPLTESELVKNIYIISIICGFFSIVSVLFMQWTVGNYSIIIPFVFIIIFTLPTILLLYKYPRIRGTIILMFILLLLSILFLIAIDLFIMPLKYPDFNLLVVSIPVNILFSLLLYTPMLLFWYYITLKYFWWQIRKMKEIQ
jgi:hypothetical protein